MQALDLVVRGLAAARLTQLVVEDEITESIRRAVYVRSVRTEGTASGVGVVQPWDAIDTAINCHACTSIWAGGAVLTADRLGPVGRFLVRTLALSQAALAVKSVIERIDR